MVKFQDTFYSPHFNERPSGQGPDTIVLHSMYCPFPEEGRDPLDPEVCINWLDYCQVSSHYLISQEGKTYQLVHPTQRAWHAGVSKMPDGRENVNNFSIGIELISPREGSYPEIQIQALRDLILALKGQFKIEYILGHADVAVRREATSNDASNAQDYLLASKNEVKSDPWNFPWQLIADLL